MICDEDEAAAAFRLRRIGEKGGYVKKRWPELKPHMRDVWRQQMRREEGWVYDRSSKRWVRS
jgi:hypothetical protein